MSKPGFTCPCCGYQTLSEPPGSYEICTVCYWEDDLVQLLDPAYSGGANSLSLIECQKNYSLLGACEDRFLKSVRAPDKDEVRDKEWRPVIKSDLKFASRPRDLSPADRGRPEAWYYWKREAI